MIAVVTPLLDDWDYWNHPHPHLPSLIVAGLFKIFLDVRLVSTVVIVVTIVVIVVIVVIDLVSQRGEARAGHWRAIEHGGGA